MAIANINYYSKVMNFSVDMNVILPENRSADENLPVLYLLHGLSDNHNAWLNMTSLVRYTKAIYPELCIVMPAGDKSYYTDMKYGKRYYTHIAEELPMVVHSMFHINSDKDKTYIAGLSMGGYGALKIGMSRADFFSKIASFSPVADLGARAIELKEENSSIIDTVYAHVLGIDLQVESKDDTRYLAHKCVKNGNSPQLMMCCGTDDTLYSNYCDYINYLDTIGYKYIRYDDDGYAHTWDYWDICIQRALRFFKS